MIGPMPKSSTSREDANDNDLPSLISYGFLAGLVSALVVIAFDPFSEIGAGAIFGAAFVVYYFLFSSIRSTGNAFAFLVVSTVSYGISFALAFFLGITTGESSDRTVGIIPFAVAGAFGGFLLAAAALLFLSSTRRLRHILNRALVCSLFGGFLGAVGWLIGGFVEQTFAKAASSIVSNVGETVVVVWQIGMGLVLGILFADDSDAFVAASKLPPSNAQKITRWIAVSVAAVLILQLLLPRLLYALHLR
jgi:hypothetical protein